MMLPKVFENFVNGSPVTVMIRGIMEHALPAAEIDQLFTDTAEHQYTRELLFSSIVDVMGEVVCRIRPSIHAGYQADPAKFGVSLRAVYDKREHTEPGVSAALVASTARKLAPVIQRLGGGLLPLLKGYRVRILDGNHLAGTEHRLKELRTLAAGALPGHTLAVLDAETMLVTEVLCCEDDRPLGGGAGPVGGRPGFLHHGVLVRVGKPARLRRHSAPRELVLGAGQPAAVRGANRYGPRLRATGAHCRGVGGRAGTAARHDRTG
jgi:hypothetical protein